MQFNSVVLSTILGDAETVPDSFRQFQSARFPNFIFVLGTAQEVGYSVSTTITNPTTF